MSDPPVMYTGPVPGPVTAKAFSHCRIRHFGHCMRMHFWTYLLYFAVCDFLFMIFKPGIL